jgi:capsular exopolysaccharide synthesis family protein
MASTLVTENHRVLYIDANFRRPISSKVFSMPSEGNGKSHADFGLSNYLLGQCSDPKDIVRSSGMEGLDIIDSGPLPPNPAEVLGSTTMKNLLNTFRDSYDYILIDGPALLVSDAKSLASLAEGTLVVFNATHTRKGEAQRALRELKDIQASVVGTVLLGVETLKGGYFGELYRAYQQYQQVPQKA